MKKNQLRGAVTGSVGAALLGLSVVTGMGAANADASMTTANTTTVATATATPTATSAPAPTAPTAPTIGNPTLTFSAASGAPGATIGVTGSGFYPGSTVYIIFDRNVQAAALPTDATGSFSGSFVVPNLGGGDHNVTASSLSVVSPAVPFNVLAPVQPGTHLSTTTAAPGSTFTISGANFAPGMVLTIVFHSTPTVLGTTVVQPNGSFSFTGSVPANAPAGGHQVQAVSPNGTVLTSVPFTVAAAVAPTPAPSAAAPAAPTTTGSNPVSAAAPKAASGSALVLGSGAPAPQAPAAQAPAAQVPAVAAAPAKVAGTAPAPAVKAANRGLKVQTAAVASPAGPQLGLSAFGGTAGAAMLVLGLLAFRRQREA